MTSILLCFTTSLLLRDIFLRCLSRRSKQENQHLTSTMEDYLERLSYIKLKHIAPNPQGDFNHRAIVHPPPATRDDMKTPAWSRYLPDLPKPKSTHGWVSCPPHEEDAELREKSAARNKVWYNFFSKKDYSKTENESFCFNVMKKHRSTKSLNDILLTRKPTDDVIGSPASDSYSV